MLMKEYYIIIIQCKVIMLILIIIEVFENVILINDILLAEGEEYHSTKMYIKFSNTQIKERKNLERRNIVKDNVEIEESYCDEGDEIDFEIIYDIYEYKGLNKEETETVYIGDEWVNYSIIYNINNNCISLDITIQ